MTLGSKELNELLNQISPGNETTRTPRDDYDNRGLTSWDKFKTPPARVDPVPQKPPEPPPDKK